MKKQSFLIAIFLFFATVINAQFDTSFAKTNILRCADSLSQAFLTKNWEKYSRYSYPALIGVSGGKKAFIDYLASNFDPVPIIAWKQYKPGNVLQVVKTERELQAVVELLSILEWKGMRSTSVSYLIAQSWDGGLYWTFFDSQSDKLAAKAVNPQLSDQLVLPEKNEKTEETGLEGTRKKIKNIP